jgi:hypothetical protein
MKCPLRGQEPLRGAEGRHPRTDPDPPTKPPEAPLLNAAGELNTLRLQGCGLHEQLISVRGVVKFMSR